jgi:sterol desaturase/sphingolipid hydroxylase (fatty acid hydroxylase superfamily)
MTFTQELLRSLQGMFPQALIFATVPLIPFILAERIWPVGQVPRWRDYSANILISLSTAYLYLPMGIAAGLWSARLRAVLPWKPFAFTFDSLVAVPVIGSGLEILALIFVPVFLHDLWFYWAHRLAHRVPLLWALHRIHHSDEHMNASSWARDHFLQEGWNRLFSIFTLGLIVDLDPHAAGKAAVYSGLFLSFLSMFYHSAIRVQLPWLDRILVTPQVHRVHHAVDRAYYDRNFVDALPVFDILFGTYHRPGKDEFPATGLGPAFPAPRSVWSAQFGPLLEIGRSVLPMLRRAQAG